MILTSDIGSYSISKQTRRQAKKHSHTKRKERIGKHKHHDHCSCEYCLNKKKNKISMKILNKRYCRIGLSEVINDKYNKQLIYIRLNSMNPATHLCLICRKKRYHHLYRVKCNLCKKYLSSQLGIHSLIYRLCRECIVSIDVCSFDFSPSGLYYGKSKFCSFQPTFYSRSNKNYKIQQLQPIMYRTGRTEWKWNDNIYQYKFTVALSHYRRDKTMLNCFTGGFKMVDDTMYRLFFNPNPKQLKICKQFGCNNKEIAFKYCLNHNLCINCGMNNRDLTHRKCRNCTSLYCKNNFCGSVKQFKCRNCYIKMEKDDWMNILQDCISGVFYDTIIQIILDYCIGFAFYCANYKLCNNIIFGDNSLDFENKQDINHNTFHYYFIEDMDMDVNQFELSYFNQKYIRIFCNKCTSYEICGCRYRYCRNKDKLFAHYEDGRRVISRCSCIIHTNIPFYHCELSLWGCDWQYRDQYGSPAPSSLKKCRICLKYFCKYCIAHHIKDTANDKLHYEFRLNERNIIDQKHYKEIEENNFELNTHLMNCDVISKYNELYKHNNYYYKRNNFYKKSSRKYTKNKKKNKAYWKRKNDKTKNIKFNKKTKRLFNFNEYL